MTETVIGSWRMNRVPLPGRLAIRTEPRTACTMLCTTSSPTPAAGDGRDLLLGREAREEEEVEQLGLAQPAGHRGVGQPALDDLGAQALEVDAAAVVGQDQLEHPGAVAGLQADGAGRRLAGGAAVLGPLEAVVQRVADQVVQRCLEPVEDVAVDAGGLAGDLEPRLLAQLAGQVADQPGEAADAVGQRAHPAGQHLVVQPAGEVLAARAPASRANRPSRPGPASPRRPGPGPWPAAPARRPRQAVAAGRAPVIDRRSSRTCSVSISRDCRSRSRQSASTIGRSRWLCTRASPARPISRVRLSAVTRTTRSLSRSRSRVGRLRRGLRARVPAAVWLADGRLGVRSGRSGIAGSGSGCGSGGRRSVRRRLRRRLDPALLDGTQVGDEGVDLVGMLGLPGRQFRLADLRDLHQEVDAPEQDVDVLRPEDQLALLGRDEAVLHRVGDPDRGIQPDDPRRPLQRVRRAHQGLDRLGRGRRALQRHQARR